MFYHGLAMKKVNLPDSGKKQEFPTGAHRDSHEGKGRFDLIPPKALAALARHYQKGADKYGSDNWRKGMPINRFLDSAIRHIYNYLSEDRSEDHLSAAAWNILCAYETNVLIDDGVLPVSLK